MFFKTLLSIALNALVLCTAQAQTSTTSSATQPTYRLTGHATLTSNFVERGLTQTKNDPGMQAAFWFNLGSQFRLGLWGANVRYDSTPTTHFWLKGKADVKVDFSQNAIMNIIYSESKFYKANKRDGNSVSLNFNFWGYKVIYDMLSNWEGTRSKAQYAGFGKDTTIWTDWIWANEGGYIMPKADGVQGFFDVRSGLGTKAKDILLMATATYTTATGAFKKEGELHLLVSASADF